jgi:hypothetical protein
VKIAVVMAAFLWVVLKALWLRLSPPQGTEIKPREAPELFAMIEELRRALRSPRFHHVLVTDDFNAPWSRRAPGAPRLEPQLPHHRPAACQGAGGAAVQGGAGARVRSPEQGPRPHVELDLRAEASLEPSHGGSRGDGELGPLSVPAISALVCAVLQRLFYPSPGERIRGRRHFGAARDEARRRRGADSGQRRGSFLEERFWPQIVRRADEMPRPAFAPFAAMGAQVAAGIDTASIEAWLDQALARKTTLDDTHPSLGERLGALGEKPALALRPRAPPPTACSALARAPHREFDQRWHDGILPSWQERHREVQQARRGSPSSKRRTPQGRSSRCRRPTTARC